MRAVVNCTLFVLSDYNLNSDSLKDGSLIPTCLVPLIRLCIIDRVHTIDSNDSLIFSHAGPRLIER